MHLEVAPRGGSSHLRKYHTAMLMQTQQASRFHQGSRFHVNYRHIMAQRAPALQVSSSSSNCCFRCAIVSGHESGIRTIIA